MAAEGPVHRVVMVMVMVNGGIGLMVEEEEALSSLLVYIDVFQGSSALPLFFFCSIFRFRVSCLLMLDSAFFGLGSLFSCHC